MEQWEGNVHYVEVHVPPPVPRIHISLRDAAALQLHGYSEAIADLERLSQDALAELESLQVQAARYGKEVEARVKALERKRAQIAHGATRNALRVSLLAERVRDHWGGPSATLDLYAQALMGDAEALEAVWSADLDESPFIDDLRALLADIHDLQVRSAWVHAEARKIVRQVHAAEALRPDIEPPPHLPAPRLVLSGSVEVHAPTVLTDVTPVPGHSVGNVA